LFGKQKCIKQYILVGRNNDAVSAGSLDEAHTNLHRQFVAIAVASLLTGTAPAKIASLGMVTHAERAHIGGAEASTGSTIFGGERLSTEAGGILRISIPALTLQLGGHSSVVLGYAAGPEGNMLAELAYGTLVFSAAPTAAIVVAANEAVVRPAPNAATVAQVWIVNGKELRIYAQRGALEFSYHGESQTMPEGNYRVVLDPSEREVAAAGLGQTTKPPGKHSPTFIFVAITVAVAVGIAIPLIMHASESPDRPGPSPSPPPNNP